MSKNFEIIDHPVAQHKLGCLRDKNTVSQDFRRLTGELAGLIMYEASKKFQTVDETVSTPLANAVVKKIKENPIIISVMRAGNGMIDGLLSVLPNASAGHIGIYRDKFVNNTVEYYFKVPDQIAGRTVFIADPLVATGDTAVACIDRIKQFEPKEVIFLSFLISPEGKEKVHHFHPDVKITCLSLEEGLNSEGYLLPGLGDAGNRLYQLK